MNFEKINQISIICLYLIMLSRPQFINRKGIQNQHHDDKLEIQHSCIEFQQPIIYVQPFSDNTRLLQHKTEPQIHGFKITTELIIENSVSQTSILQKIQIIKQLLKIGSKFFEVVLKVKQQKKADTLYRERNCGKLSVPLKFRTQGFHPNETDMLIFITTSLDKQTMTKAYSSTCQFVHRPNYGRINYNLQRMNYKNLGNYQFHRQILITMHEITHILVLNTLFYLPDQQNSQFYTSPSTTVKRKLSEVIIKNPAREDTYMIITPKVRRFVQQYFNCSENIGGLLTLMNNTILKNSTLKTLPGSHWEQSVVFDQFMMPMSYPSLGKISKLTLLLMQDSGFFDFVDVQMSQKSTFGKGKGCQFAKGIKNNKTSEYCFYENQKVFSCDFYNTYAGACQQNLIRGGGQGICQQSRQRKFNVYEEKSRCIDLTQDKQSTFLCTLAECVNGAIQIKIADQKAICLRGQKTVFIKVYNVTVHCPKDFEVFCSVSFCQDWCSKQGICLAGKCLLKQCQNRFSFECDQCLKYNNGTLQCINTKDQTERTKVRQQQKVIIKEDNQMKEKASSQALVKDKKQQLEIQLAKSRINCQKNCIQCQKSSDKCLKCQENYGTDAHNVLCIICSDKKCKTCKTFPFYCVQCFQGKPDHRGICIN